MKKFGVMLALLALCVTISCNKNNSKPRNNNPDGGNNNGGNNNGGNNAEVSAPENFRILASVQSLTLSWDLGEGQDHYVLLVDKGKAAGYREIEGVGNIRGVTSYSLSTPLYELDWSRFRYKVRACNADKSSCRDSSGVPLSLEDSVAATLYLKASNAGAGDKFGTSVSLDGDTLAVGVPDEDSNATGVNGAESNNSAVESGAVYVFVKSGSTWTQQAYIKASNAEAEDGFGTSVSLDGDTLVVGASDEDSNATGVNSTESDNSGNASGAVYVFTRSGTTWTQQAYIKASNAEAGDNFGASVSLDGDTLAVGAAGEDSNVTGVNDAESDDSAGESGAVYVFTRSGSTWTQQAYIKASNTNVSDNFGISVSLDGDTLAVGAIGEDSDVTGVNGTESNDSEDGSGAVYVFTRSGSTWTQQAYVKASNTGRDDAFGTSVSLDGDTLAVGAIGEGSNAIGVGGDSEVDTASESGAVYVFTRSGTTWTQQAYIKASNTEAGDKFGAALSLDGNTLAVAAHLEASAAKGIGGMQTSNSAEDSGAVYVFTRSGTTWTQQAYVKASNTGSGDEFGGSISLSGGGLVVGALNEEGNGMGVGGNQGNNDEEASGAVYIY